MFKMRLNLSGNFRFWTVSAFLMLIAGNALSQTYYGVGLGRGDYSKYSIADAEVSSLAITRREVEPQGFNVFVGLDVSDWLSYEVGYNNLGRNKTSGNVSGAYADQSGSTQVLFGSALLKHNFGSAQPYFRLGLGLSQNESSTIKSGNASSVFSNAQNESKTYAALRPVYGVGLDVELNKYLTFRVDHLIIRDGQVDLINNIDNGYISRPYKYSSVALVYRPDGRSEYKPDSLASTKWSLGVSGGFSRTNAIITPQRYSGNNWNLQSGGRYTDVAGAMFNDKTDRSYRFELIAQTPEFDYALYLASLGEFKAKSATRGLTGGGNAITGAVSRTLLALGATVGTRFYFSDSKKIFIVPKVGVAVVSVRDEIYNNLDFTGVGGSARGPIVTKLVMTPTVGVEIANQVSPSTTFLFDLNYFARTGNQNTLGQGSTTTFGFGIRRAF